MKGLEGKGIGQEVIRKERRGQEAIGQERTGQNVKQRNM